VEHDFDIKLIPGPDAGAKPVMRTAAGVVVDNGSQPLLRATQADP
jgi:hypothetical protein